jgi:TetR/AcrR family transcriptional repressor of mexJK operon
MPALERRQDISRRDQTTSSRPGVGRPSREQQALRDAELLDHALDVFLDRGFEVTTMEEIAAGVGMSKRTIYARHEDKAALFRAAINRAVERYTVSRAELERLRQPDLEATLVAVAHARIANIATPVVTKLQRVLSAQSYRFPDLAVLAFEEGAGPAIAFLADLLEEAGDLRAVDPRAAATAFLSLVVGGVTRKIVLGGVPGEAEIDARVRFAVDLFLNGLRRRA